MIYKVLNTPSLFDLILSVYGTLDESVQLLYDNNLNFNSIPYPEQEIEYNINYVIMIPPQPVISAPVQANPIIKYKAFYNQNIFDIALNTYGGLDYVVKLLLDNSMDWNSNYFTTFVFDSSLIEDINVYNYGTGKGVVYVTGNILIPVYGTEDGTIIYESEDGSKIYQPE